ncbi:MAG: right-handed parallel beta-helix repeat-containing protein [Chlamydiota bacterium]
MNDTAIRLSWLCLFQTIFMSTLSANNNLLAPAFEQFHKDSLMLAQSTKNQEKQSNQDTCNSPFHTMHVGLRHIEANGVGYTNGYTTLEGFGIHDYCNSFMPFLDLRGHVFNNGKLAGNVGIGARSYLRSINHLLGYYLYYDIRQGGHHLTAQQLSPGIELLGKRMEYRINGYFPVGNQKSHAYDYSFDEFKDNNIILKYKKQYVMKGVDAEIGVHIAQNTNYDFYAGAGPYYFQAPHDKSWGGKVRLNGKYREYVTLEGSYSYDHVFGSIFQGSVGISIPFGKRIRKKEAGCPKNANFLAARESQSPYRFEIPIIKKHTSITKAINPSTGDPWIVWFVDNTSSSLGTFKSPFSTLVQAQNASLPNEIIYVFPGDGTSTGLNAGITLQDNQKLFGSGVSQSISTTNGNIKIPKFSSTLPLLTNSSGNTIVLANNNEISGLRLTTNDGSSTPGVIFGSGISGGNIHDNTVFAAVEHQGVQITGIGSYSIKNNHFFGPTGAGNGISLSPDLGGITAIIKNNTVTGYALSLFLNANVMGGSGGDFTVIRNSFSEATSTGIFFNSVNANSGSIVSIDSNTITSIAGNSIDIQTSKNLCLTVNNNLILNSGQNGLYIERDIPSVIEVSNTFASITNNTISGVGGAFYGVECLTFEPFCLILHDNIAVGGTGFFLDPGGNGLLSADISGNSGTLKTGTAGDVTLVPPSTCSCSK